MDRELLLLKLRSAIADKEWVTACANHDTAKFGSWQCDWYSDIQAAHQEIEALTTLLTPTETLQLITEYSPDTSSGYQCAHLAMEALNPPTQEKP